jgi:phosphoribosylformimino-5-aminoimidazole carboxamide ribonucleotide (ProFAR) isomerase
MNPDNLETPNGLVSDIKTLIEQSKKQVSVAVNATITMLYWNIGKKINIEILKDQRAEYGKQIVNSLSSQLTTAYGKGWSEKQLRHCLRFAETFQEEQIVSTLWRQLS